MSFLIQSFKDALKIPVICPFRSHVAFNTWKILKFQTIRFSNATKVLNVSSISTVLNLVENNWYLYNIMVKICGYLANMSKEF